MSKKNLYIIAGCNGAGKTTASFTVLPEMLDCQEFVNADEIAKEISPSKPELAAFKAGRLMLTKIDELLSNNESFAFETTLSTKSYKQKIEEAKRQGYTATLVFFWLNNIDLAKERVEIRVLEGGHNIEPDVIERRYIRGIKNLFEIYWPVVDGAFMYDNSRLGIHELIARKTVSNDLEVFNNDKFRQIRNYYDHN